MTNDSFSGFHSLPPGTCLHDTYRIRKTIGAGGFGITYMSVRMDTGQVIAIKEYFPSSFAVRNRQEGVFTLQPFPDKNTEMFQKGRQRFLNEAKILKSFPDLESIVSVYDLFEENGTVYLVMEYIDGLTLSQYIHENSTLTFPEIAELMVPVIHSLSKIHETGLLHRDISPDNLILGIDNRLHLIDFGAASHDISKTAKNTVILKAGYAPPEQYIPNGKTGAWTDIYAICATMYFALTGKTPTEAMTRLDSDSPLIPELQNQLLPWQRAILEKGLKLRPSDRFQTAEELYLALTEMPVNARDAVTTIETNVSSKDHARIRKLYRHRTYHRGLLVFSGAILLCAAVLLAASYLSLSRRADIAPQDAAIASAAPVPTPTPALVEQKPSEKPAQTQMPAHTPTLLVMQDLTGMTRAKAEKKLKALDPSIRIDISYAYSSSKKAGIITRQSVAAGTTFSEKQIASISLTISKGKRPPATSAPASSSAKKTSKPSDYHVKEDNNLTSIPLE